MQRSSRLLALVALGGAVALAACGGSPELSPVASTTAITNDSGSVTSSGNGPGGQPSPAPGTGTCTNDCDGTGQGPGPGAGNGPGNGNGYGPGPGPSGGFCGDACTGPVGPDPSDIGEILRLAVQEEYGAESLYRGVLLQFGAGAMPFAVIADSEARHVEALLMLYARRPQLQPPPRPPVQKSAFGSIPEACAAGVTAETKDAAFYTPYLERGDLPQDVENVFTNLQAASLYNHLPAFERCQ